MAKIELPDTQVEILRDFYTTKAKPIWDKFQAVKSQWDEMEPVLVQLGILESITKSKKDAVSVNTNKSETVIKNGNNGGFDINWSWLNKAKFILKEHTALTSLDIIDVLLKHYEPTLERKKAMNSLPATLSVAAKDNKIHRYQNENGEFVYELKK